MRPGRRTLLLILTTILLPACVWQPVAYDASERESVGAAVASFREQQALQPFFEEAVAYVVFPLSVRAGSAFGGAYGSGWLIENGEAVGQVYLFEFFAGPNIGAQAYRQILFFRDAGSLELFKRGRTEFVGQASAAVTVVGASGTPSFNQQVALFRQLRGGLMVEASVGAQRYQYVPLPADG